MKEAAIKAILLSYYKDLAHSTNYLKLASKIKKDQTTEEVMKDPLWGNYKFETPQIKTHVMVYGKKKNACFELAAFDRTVLPKVEVYMINRRKLVIPLVNVDVAVLGGLRWKQRNVQKTRVQLETIMPEETKDGPMADEVKELKETQELTE